MMERVSVKRDSAAEVTDANDGFRAGPPGSLDVQEACDTFDEEVREVGSTEEGAGRALISREALRLATGPPSPSLSLVMKPEPIEPVSSTEPLRNGLEMLDLEMGLRRLGLVIEKLLGGAAPRTDLRGLAGIPVRADKLFAFEAGWALDGGAPV